MADINEMNGRLIRLEYWRDGNGTPGAAAKLVHHDQRIETLEQRDKAESNRIKTAVHEAMDERAKSKEGRSRANAPIIAASISTIGMIIIALLTIFFGQ